MRCLFFLTIILSSVFISPIYSKPCKTTDTRSDSIDITNYKISLSIRNLSLKTISGFTEINMLAKVSGVNSIRLDFLKLTPTKISISGIDQAYSKNDSIIFVQLSSTKNIGDTFTLRIEYTGQPVTDPQWGGFYFSGNYAFNLGVGFVVDPHNFGRCWFPCFDNFIERSTFDLYITTDSGYKAVCGGTLQSQTTNTDNSITWNWKLQTPVPSYLASVAVSKYELVNSTYTGLQRNIPIAIASLPSDTSKVKSSFVHLPNALSIFENHYGAYQFERVGYSVVPFSGGAMEHATNIAYPLFAVDGTTTYETLYAHELSHHWWGDLATCRTAGDMWLNEGWANYSERVFLENVYDKQHYRDDVKSNHLSVLRYAHIKDAGFRAVAGIPHQYTYGEHVYHKGSDAIHTLRTYMGDSAFFAACKSYLNQYKFKDVSTVDLIQHFKPFTNADLSSFFNDWILNPGFCDFVISLMVTDGSLNTKVIVQQNLRAANNYYTNVPLSITFYDQHWNAVTKNFTMSGASKEVSFPLSFSPIFAVIDQDENISYARTKNTVVLKAAGFTQLNDALMGITVTSISDSAMLHVEHHWTAADQSKCTIPGIYVSNYRYWKVDGIWPANFKATAFLNYDGTMPSAFNSGYLDHTFIRQTEDSLVLLWRPDETANWQIVADSIAGKTMGGSKTDKVGRFWLKDLKKGEYVFGMYDVKLGINEPQESSIKEKILIYPNPSNDIIKIVADFTHQDAVVKLFDIQGRCVLQNSFSSLLQSLEIDVTPLQKGNYILQWNDGVNHVNKNIIIK